MAAQPLQQQQQQQQRPEPPPFPVKSGFLKASREGQEETAKPAPPKSRCVVPVLSDGSIFFPSLQVVVEQHGQERWIQQLLGMLGSAAEVHIEAVVYSSQARHRSSIRMSAPILPKVTTLFS